MSPTITRVETAPVRIVGPSLIVRIWAGDVCGIGECYPSGPVSAVDHVVQSLEEQLIGEDPRDINRLHEKLRRWHLFTGGQAGTVITAVSGLELALWDLAGKLHQAPVFQLLGGAFRRRIRLYADCHAGTVDAAGHHRSVTDVPDPATQEGRDRFTAAARTAIERGFTAVKFDVDDVYGELQHDGWNRTLTNAQIERMVRQVGVIREAIGPDFDLAIDMHARFDVPSAIRAAQALEEFNLLWLEEPVPPRTSTRWSPFGPELAPQFAPARTCIPVTHTSSCWVAGPSTASCQISRNLVASTRVAALPTWPNSITSRSHHTTYLGPSARWRLPTSCAAVSNFTVLEYHALDVAYFEALVSFSSGPVVQDGHIEVSDAPGFGIELNEEVAMEHWHEKSGLPFFGDRGRHVA